MPHSKTVGTIRPKSHRQHLRGYEASEYVNLRSKIGAENIISNVGQRYQLLSKGIIDLALIKKCTKSDNPVIEAFYGYAYSEYTGDKPWTSNHYKVYVKFAGTDHFIRIDNDILSFGKFTKQLGDILIDDLGGYRLKKIEKPQIMGHALETLNLITAHL